MSEIQYMIVPLRALLVCFRNRHEYMYQYMYCDFQASI